MFQTVEEFSTNIISIIDPANALIAVAVFKSVVSAWFALYVMFVGFSFVWGKTHTPIRDITERFIIYSIIGAFAFNIGDWYGYAVAIIEELNDWAGGTNNGLSVYESLDLLNSVLSLISEQYVKNDESAFYHFEALLGTLIIYVFYYAFGITFSLILIINTIVLQVLVFLFPIALVTLFFPPFRGIFANWLKLMVSNILSLLLITLFFEMIRRLVSNEISRLLGMASELPITSSAFEVAGYFVVGIFLALMTTSLASSLAGASVDRIAGTAARGTAGGIVAGVRTGAKGVGSLGKGASFAIAGRKPVYSGSGSVSGSPLHRRIGGGGAVGVGVSSVKGIHGVYRSGRMSLQKRREAILAKNRSGGYGSFTRTTNRSARSSHSSGSNGAFSRPYSRTSKSYSKSSASSSKYAKYAQINKYKRAKEGE